MGDHDAPIWPITIAWRMQPSRAASETFAAGSVCGQLRAMWWNLQPAGQLRATWWYLRPPARNLQPAARRKQLKVSTKLVLSRPATGAHQTSEEPDEEATDRIHR